MTDKNKLQEDAYVYCQKELDRLREDNINLRLDVMYYKTLLKRARDLMNMTKDWACTEATETMIAKIDQAVGEGR